MQSLTEGVALEHINTRLREAAEDRKVYALSRPKAR